MLIVLRYFSIMFRCFKKTYNVRFAFRILTLVTSHENSGNARGSLSSVGSDSPNPCNDNDGEYLPISFVITNSRLLSLHIPYLPIQKQWKKSNRDFTFFENHAHLLNFRIFLSSHFFSLQFILGKEKKSFSLLLNKWKLKRQTTLNANSFFLGAYLNSTFFSV